MKRDTRRLIMIATLHLFTILQINDATIKLLLNNFFTKILLIEPKFITCVVQKPEFFELILNKLKDLLKLNTSQKVSALLKNHCRNSITSCVLYISTCKNHFLLQKYVCNSISFNIIHFDYSI